MVRETVIVALSAISMSWAATAEPEPENSAPQGTSTTRYCMHVGPVTGNLAERIECWTRQEWTDQGVDLDKEWAKEGVRTIG